MSQPVADQVLSQLTTAERDSAELLSCPDGRRLCVILEEMISCVEDGQQRSWHLHCDEPAIVEYLQELSALLVSLTRVGIGREGLNEHEFVTVS